MGLVVFGACLVAAVHFNTCGTIGRIAHVEVLDKASGRAGLLRNAPFTEEGLAGLGRTSPAAVVADEEFEGS